MKAIKIMPLLVVLLMAACTKEPCQPPKEEPTTCATKGKFEKAICGWGIYDQMWIRLDNGMLLQPCKSSVAMLDKSQIYEGREVELSYDILDESAADCNALTTCLAWPGEFKSINITCIKLAGEDRTQDCNQMGVLHDQRGKLDGCGWLVELNDGTVLDLGLQVDETQFNDGVPVFIGYVEENRFTNCMAGIPVKVTCMRVANTTTH